MTQENFSIGQITDGDKAAEKARGGKRPYEAPRILSDEPLEVAAAICNPPTAGFGKSYPGFPCAAASGS